MTNQSEIEALSLERIPSSDLPIGVFTVLKDGTLVDCNEKVMQVFNISDTNDINVKRFYEDPHQREKLVDILSNGQGVEKFLVDLRIGGELKTVQINCEPIQQQGIVIGWKGCLTDITEEKKYSRLSDDLPAGVYQVNKDDIVINANPAFVKMLGYNSFDALKGIHVKDHYVNPEDADDLQNEIIEKEKVQNKIIHIRKLSGEEIVTSVNAVVRKDADGNYNGREGTVVDVTMEQLYKGIMDYIPMGLFKIKNVNGEDIIEHCNLQYAKLNGFGSPEEAIGTPVKRIYPDEDEYQKFMKELVKKDGLLLDYVLNGITLQGEKKVFNIYCQAIYDKDGNLTGRVGAERDISSEIHLRELYDHLIQDIGNMLHTYSQTLSFNSLSFDAIERSLTFSMPPNEVAFNLSEMDQKLGSFARHIYKALDRLIHKLESFVGEDYESITNDLIINNQLLKKVHSNVPKVEHRPHAFRDISIKIGQFCKQLQALPHPKEEARQVVFNIEEMLRYCSLITIYLSKKAIIEMDHTVSAVRGFVTSGKRDVEPKTVCRAKALLKRAVRNLEEYAYDKGVRINLNVKNDCELYIQEREILRALGNLVHNAIKYSWKRSSMKASEAAYIDITAITDWNEIRIEIENWGVPITQEELEEKLVYNIGYRGIHSGDRQRAGTGIGLADSFQVVKSHCGELDIDSWPASNSRNSENYNQPYITTVKLTLPIHLKDIKTP